LTLSRSVTVLGSTGSIGVSTLDLLEAAQNSGSAEVQVVALTAGRNVERLAEQALKWRPQRAVIEDESRLEELRDRLAGSGIAAAAGRTARTPVAARGMDGKAFLMLVWMVGIAAGLAQMLAALAVLRRWRS